MVRSGNEFNVVQELPRGKHQYKFIVDDQWRHDPSQPKAQDSEGKMNNLLDLSTYQCFTAGEVSQDPKPKYKQDLQDLNEFTGEPPLVPMVLSRSGCSAVPPRPHFQSQHPLMSICTHSLCDHVYIQDSADEASATCVAVTHRYGHIYSTTIFITRSPFGVKEGGLGNRLKAVIRRGGGSG